MKKNKLIFFLIFAVLVIGLVDWWAEYRTEQKIRAQTAQSLQAILDSTQKAIEIWLDERMADTLSISRSRVLINMVEQQLADLHNKPTPASVPAGAEISDYLRPLLEKHGYAAFSVIRRDGSVIASNRPGFLTGEEEYLDQAFSGRSFAAPPMKIQIHPFDADAPTRQKGGTTCIVLVHPIRNPNGRIIAAFAVALDLYKSLTKVASLSGFDRTGETYAFDKNGLLATASRFEDQLRRAGLLLPGRPSAGNVYVRDPGGDMTTGFKPTLPRSEQPFTRMASEALAGRNGVDVMGYRDYRGVMVVGSWTWNKKLGLGLATEIDRAEIYQILRSVRLLSLAVLALTILAAASLLIMMWKNNIMTSALSKELQTALSRSEEEVQQRLVIEKDLLKARDSLLEAQTVARLGNWDWNLVDNSVKWSDETYRLLGLDPQKDKASFETFMNVVHPDDRALIRSSVKEAKKGTKGYEERIHRIVLPNDILCWVEVKGEVFRDAAGTPIRMVGTLQDIDRRKRAEDTLLEYRTLIEGSDQQYAVVDRNHTYKLVNNEYLKIRGIQTKAEVLGRHLKDILGKELYEHDIGPHLDQAFNGNGQVFEIKITYPDRITRDMSIRYTPIRETGHEIDRVAVVLTDITKRKQAEEALIKSEQRYRSVVEDNPVFIRSVLPHGKIDFANRAYCEYIEKTLDEVVGLDLKSLVPPGEQKATWGALQALSAQNPVNSHEHREIAAGDAVRWQRWTNRAIFEENGTIQSYLSFGEDITESKIVQEELKKYRKNLEQTVLERTNELTEANQNLVAEIQERKQTAKALQQAKIAAEAANEAKTRFLANMSHEIRTPMNSIIGYVDLTLDTPELAPQSKRNLATASRSARQLLRLLNNILDISKLEAGKMEMETVRFNLFTLLDDVLSIFKPKVSEKGLSLHLEPDSELAQCYLGDSTRLRQVLINLVDNAVKFTSEGGITVHVAPQPRNKHLHFAVLDTGIGIPPEKIDTILEPFAQADITATRRFGGTGLGTAISRQIVEMMGGRFWVESELGRGTTFHFTVDLPESECSATCTTDCEEYRRTGRPGEDRNDSSPPGRVFNVLIVEDIEENAELAKIRIAMNGHRVVHAWNGREAVEAWKSGDFDLILMDVQMPEMDGLEATRRIRELEHGSGRRTPIIAMTASVMREEKERCMAADMDQVMGKPVDFPILFALMEQIVPKGKGMTGTRESNPPDTVQKRSLSSLPGIDVTRGLRRWQDPSAYRKALKVFAESHAEAAAEICTLLDAGDLEESYHKAHALKGLAGNLAMENVYSITVQLDKALKSEQTDRARQLLTPLTGALAVVVKGICSLPEQNDKPTPPLEDHKDFDKAVVSGLLRKLLIALDQDTPSAAEPVLERLGKYLRTDCFEKITAALADFDFSSARKETVNLAGRLAIQLEEQ